MIQVAVASLAVVLIWVVGGEETTKTIVAKLLGTAAIVCVVPVVFMRKLMAVPAVMEAEMSAELDRLRIPEGGPQPDWPLGELYHHLDPNVADSNTAWEAIDRAVLDKIGTGHLTIWGRERRGDSWGPLFAIAPSWFQQGGFTHFFLLEGHEDKDHYGGGGPRGEDRRFGDMQVNRAEALKLWPSKLSG